MNAVTHAPTAAVSAAPLPRLPHRPGYPRCRRCFRGAGALVPGEGTGVLPGLALAVAVAAAATVVGQHVPLVGSAVPGAVIGAVIALAIKPGARLAPGIKYAGTFLLQCSVVLLGAQLSLEEAARVGLSSLPVMLGPWPSASARPSSTAGCSASRGLAYADRRRHRHLRRVGDRRGLPGDRGGVDRRGLRGVDDLPVQHRGRARVPAVGHAIGMSQQSFGLFAGTAVNDTSSVVATASTYGAAAASHAIVVKLVRTLMIIPVCLGLAGLTARRQRAELAAGTAGTGTGTTGAGTGTAGTGTGSGTAGVGGSTASPHPAASAGMSPLRVVRLVPWFLIGFVVAAGLNSVGVIPSGSHGPLQHVSVFLVAVALSAIGLSTNVPALRKAGPKPVLLGALLWITVAVASLGLQTFTGTLR